jgi:hypothetical protein
MIAKTPQKSPTTTSPSEDTPYYPTYFPTDAELEEARIDPKEYHAKSLRPVD